MTMLTNNYKFYHPTICDGSKREPERERERESQRDTERARERVIEPERSRVRLLVKEPKPHFSNCIHANDGDGDDDHDHDDPIILIILFIIKHTVPKPNSTRTFRN